MNMTRKLLPALVIVTSAAAAFAMTEIDTDGDSLISMEEMQAAYPELTEAQFAQADVDGDGALSEEELAGARAAGILPEDQG
jgi:Ca2+-binding EF-hand superfamily protein